MGRRNRRVGLTGFTLELKAYSYVSLIWMIGDDDGDDDDADAGCPHPPRTFLPLSATLERYLEDFSGFPPIGKVMRMTTD